MLVCLHTFPSHALEAACRRGQTSRRPPPSRPSSRPSSRIQPSARRPVSSRRRSPQAAQRHQPCSLHATDDDSAHMEQHKCEHKARVTRAECGAGRRVRFVLYAYEAKRAAAATIVLRTMTARGDLGNKIRIRVVQVGHREGTSGLQPCRCYSCWCCHRAGCGLLLYTVCLTRGSAVEQRGVGGDSGER